MKMLKWNRFSTATLALLALMAGCRDGGDAAGADDEGGEPERGGTAILVEGSDLNKPLSIITEGDVDTYVGGMMFMSLLFGEWRDGQLVYLTAADNPMSLANSYEFLGADSASLRYHMRGDVHWSDGVKVTARDVAYTYRILADPGLASARQHFVEKLDSVIVNNDTTVTFHFESRYPEMLFHTGALGPIPEHVYGKGTPEEIRTHPSLSDPANGKLVVNGPFMISRWDKGSTITLVRNPRFRPEPHLDQIVVRIIPETTTRLVELQTGNVDFVHRIAFDVVPTLKAQSPHVRLEREERRAYEYVAYNPKAHPAFADPEIRRALGMAINEPALLEALHMGEYAEPAGGPYSPIFKQYYDPREQAPVGYQLERAKQILDEKGWRDSNGDGIRDKDGRELAFTLTTNTGNQQRADIAQVIQQHWRQAGVNAQIRQLEFNTFIESLIGKKFEAALGGWNVALSPDISDNWRAGAAYNFVSYDNPEVERLFDQALSQPTAEAAIPYWKRAAALIVRDQPYTWLHYYDQVDGVNNRLRNTKVNTLGRYLNPWEWWIPVSQQRGRAAAPAGKDSAAGK